MLVSPRLPESENTREAAEAFFIDQDRGRDEDEDRKPNE